MRTLRFALIGCGRISPKHISALIDHQESVALVSVCDLVSERAEARANQYHESTGVKPEVYTDYQAMMDTVPFDVAVIATESGYHARIALDCLEQNKHVLIEKPMALSLEDVDKINRLADEKELTVAVCYQNRFNPPIQKLRRAIDENRFGKIINGTARILWTRTQQYYDQAPWRGTKELDGGVLMNQCIHNIDLLQWMMGSPVVSVKSETGTYLRDIEMEDFGAVLIRFENGSIGIIEGSACVYPENLEETLSIFGETGTAVIGGLAVNVIETWHFADKRDYDTIPVNQLVDSVYGHGHTPLYGDLIEAIDLKRTPLVDGYEARKSLEIVLKAYE